MTHQYELQIRDNQGQWRTWERIGTNGMKIGRSPGSPHLAGLNTMAVRHLKLSYEGRELVAEDMGSLNGVYVRLLRPLELQEGTRFRLGRFVVEFRMSEPQTPPETARSEDGEEFWSAPFAAIAYLDLIQPDGKPGVRFPITKVNDRTILGRESKRDRPVDLVLHDSSISAWHAQIRHEQGKFFLDDLGSTNGTFVQCRGPLTVRPNDELLVGQLLLRVSPVMS